MYLNPDRMTPDQQVRVLDWMRQNGMPERHVALEPLLVRGGVVEYTELDVVRWRRGMDEVPTRRRRLRTRTPFRAHEAFA